MHSSFSKSFSRGWILASLIGFVLLLSGCSKTSDPVTEVGQEPPSENEISSASSSSSDSNIPLPVNPEIAWSSCYQIYECGNIEVPLDYSDPGGAKTTIGLVRIAASTSPSLGPILLNFGGPGASGTEMVYMYGSIWEWAFPEFDVIGFDPRGIGFSEQVHCPLDHDDDEDWTVEDGEDTGDFFVEARDFAASCIEMSGDLALHVGTNNVARDMDQIRIALGEEKVTYLGYSYGTRIGAVYASLFPEHVRAMVLDGAVAPSDQISAFSPVQGLGFEKAWNRFAESCDNDTSCDLNEYGGAEEAFRIADELLKVSTLEVSGGRELTRSEFHFGTASALYSPYSWAELIDGFNEIITQADGTVHQELADQLAGRREDGTYDNSQSVSFLVSCADDPLRPSDEEIALAMDAVADQLPHFGPSLRGDTGCAGLDEALDPLHVGQADLDIPALVISMEGDPATPIEWGPELVESVGDAVLITSNGDGHSAFLANSECVTEVVFDYLLNLIVPEDGWSCEEP